MILKLEKFQTNIIYSLIPFLQRTADVKHLQYNHPAGLARESASSCLGHKNCNIVVRGNVIQDLLRLTLYTGNAALALHISLIVNPLPLDKCATFLIGRFLYKCAPPHIVLVSVEGLALHKGHFRRHPRSLNESPSTGQDHRSPRYTSR